MIIYILRLEKGERLLTYSIYDLLSIENADKKINLFLIEEPENHLHKSMQIMLSQILFTDRIYPYLFVSTHSPFILYDMDEVNLVRIYGEMGVNGRSTFYQVPVVYKKTRKMLNRLLSEAIFSNRVLLVEGPSEQVLFEKVLSIIDPFYEIKGVYILSVGGIGFQIYTKILMALNIFCCIKTDNDLRSISGKDDYSVLGFSRCNKIIGENLLPEDSVQENNVETKEKLYNKNLEILNKIREKYNVYLSKSDLENDLDEVIHDKLVEYLGSEDVVEYLQRAKHHNMVKLIEHLSYGDCQIIYEHYNFACLKAVISWS